MNLTTLTHRDALCLNARFTSREEAIHAEGCVPPLPAVKRPSTR